MGKIGEATNSVDQGKPNGHQGKRKTIDDAIDENVHRKKSEYWSNGIMECWKKN
jgi:hypothetical protein